MEGVPQVLRSKTRVRTIAAAIMLSACSQRPLHTGPLATMAESIVGDGRGRCLATLPTPDYGVAQGCVKEIGDTSAYLYYVTDSGLIVATGRFWSGDSLRIRADFEALLRRTTSEFGSPTLVCDRADTAWAISDRRWFSPQFTRMLVVGTPRLDLRTGSFVQQAARLGQASCSEHHGVPWGR